MNERMKANVPIQNGTNESYLCSDADTNAASTSHLKQTPVLVQTPVPKTHQGTYEPHRIPKIVFQPT